MARTLNALGARGTVATVTAGWQERDADDAELEEHLGGRAVNLELYARYVDIRESDHEYAVADARRREILLEICEPYEVRLDAALNAVCALQRRHGTAAVRDAEVEAAIASVRELDELAIAGGHVGVLIDCLRLFNGSLSTTATGSTVAPSATSNASSDPMAR